MIFHSAHKELTYTPYVTLNNRAIYSSDSATFLGVILDKNLKFDKHIRSVTSKIAFGIRVLIKTRYFFQLSLWSLYFLFIHSHLTYCLSSWGNTYNTHLEPLRRLRNQDIHLLTLIDCRSSVQPIFHHLGILPLSLELDLKLCILIPRIRDNPVYLPSFDRTCLLNNNTRVSEQRNILLLSVWSNYGKQTIIFCCHYLEFFTPLT